jgi:peptide/nickel transport system permease protein
VYPGMAIVLFVLAWNLIGDAFRDIMDPKLQG